MKRSARKPKADKQQPAVDDGFRNWLKEMPEGTRRQAITVPVQLTLELHQWLDVAAGCKSSGITIDQAVSRLLSNSDQFCGWFNHNFRVNKDGWPITEPTDEGGAK